MARSPQQSALLLSPIFPKSLQDKTEEENTAEETDVRAAAAFQWQVWRNDGAATKFWRHSSTGYFPDRESGNAASFRKEELEGNGCKEGVRQFKVITV